MKREKLFEAITCPECGGNFVPILGEDNYRCDVCKAIEAYELDGQIHFVNRFEGLEENEFSDFAHSDERPPECTGCGSDSYPDCRDSCSFFDD